MSETQEKTTKELIAELANKVLEDDRAWGEINLVIPDDTLTEQETIFAELANIEALAHNFKQVIFDIGIRNNRLNHEFAHQAVNRLKEAVYWAKELITNPEVI